MPSLEMQTAKRTSFLHSKEFRCLIALAMGLALAFGLQPINGLTPMGVRAIAVIIPVLFLWLTVNTHWTCLLLFALLIMGQVMTPSAVWAGSLGHFAPMLVLVFTLIADNLSETGAIDKVAAWFITRPFVRGKPYMFLAMFFLSNLVIGIFMQNLALTIIYIDLAVRICKKIGVEKGHSLYLCIMLGLIWTDSVVSIASPIAKTLPNIMIGTLYTQLGITVTYAQWLAVGIPYSIAMFVAIMICVFIFKPDVTPLKNLDVDQFAASVPPLTGRGKVSLITMGVLILFVLLPDVLMTAGWLVPIASYFVSIGVTVPAILAVVFLCQFKVQGEPVMDFVRSAKGVPLTLILFIAAVVVIGIPIGADATGIVAWMGNGLQPLVAGFSPLQIIMVLSLFALLVTNFISSAVTMVLFYNIGVALLMGSGVSLGAFGILVGLAAAPTCLTPSASLTSPLFYGPDHLTVPETYKINLLNIALSFIIVISMIPFVNAIVPA